jgi:hypothetical protein
MYEFKHEKEKREKRYKLYLFLFIVLSLINISLEIKDFRMGNTSGLRLVLIPLGYSIVYSLMGILCYVMQDYI